MIVIHIGNHLKCTVDQNKGDCNKEGAHCHIQRNGKRVAQIWLGETISIQQGHTLNKQELKRVMSVVSNEFYRYKLETEYDANRRGNIDSINKQHFYE